MSQISQAHKETKETAYWDDLVEGTTSQYKEAVMEDLISSNFKTTSPRILDIGCGTCETILKYEKLLNAQSLTCIDYDAKIIDQMKAKHADKNIDWQVQDIFDLNSWKESFDLILFMDMLHEIYSFYGRPEKDLQVSVDHKLGQDHVYQALENIARITNPNGGVIITDNVLCEEDKQVVIQFKSEKVRDAVKYFLEHYSTRQFQVDFLDNDQLRINSRDLCILLTQYNKIKNEDWVRWNTERFEIHQYYTLSEYEQVFSKLGFTLHAVVGTPQATREEWTSDFQMVEGLDELPQKRITLLAIKDKA